MSLLERARQAQADRDGRDVAEAGAAEAKERAQLADRTTVILGLEPPVNAAMLEPALGDRGHRALYRFEYEGLSFVVGHYRDRDDADRLIGDSPFLAVQVEQVRGWPQWPPPGDPRSVVNTRWAPGGYHAVYDLADLADALDES